MASGCRESFSESSSVLLEVDSQGDGTRNTDGSSSNASLDRSIFTFPRENGRTYHGYHAGTYPFPNDEYEQERLDFQHCTVNAILGHRLHLAPLKHPKEILDIGTGTGAWAIEMGDKYPDTQIEATDLSPIQPTAVPDNVHFIVDDAEQEDWGVPLDKYDYVHTRLLLGCFEDYSKLIQKSYQHLKPGGWMESQEPYSKIYCDDDSMPADWPFVTFSKILDECAETSGRPLRVANKMKKWYEEAGFVDIKEKIVKIPIGAWPKHSGMKNIGTWWLQNLLLGVQGFSLAYLSRNLGWSKTEIEVYLVNVRKALSERPLRVHAYQNFYTVYGRKPN